MMDRYRERLGVEGDDEWKIIEARITKVFEARMEAGSGPITPEGSMGEEKYRIVVEGMSSAGSFSALNWISLN